MKILIKNTAMAVLFLLAITYAGVFAGENTWSIEIELAKKEYIYHESVWLDIMLTNLTSDAIQTNGLIQPNYRDFFIELKNEDGKTVEYTGPEYFLAASPGDLMIESGGQDYASLDLLTYLSSYEELSGYGVVRDRFPFLPEGQYSVKVIFDGATSNELTFNIVQPTGEEIEVLKLIEEACAVWVQDSTAPASDIYKKIVEKYPNSVFAEKCYYLSRFYSQEIWDGLKNGTYDKRNLKMEMVNKFPNSGHSKDWCNAITYGMDDVAIDEFVNNLLQSKPDTRCSKYLKIIQDRMSYQEGRK